MEQTPKTVIVNLRQCNMSFIANIKSQSTGITKRCICIPEAENFIEEGAYVQSSTGVEVRYAMMQMKMWPVTEESRAKYDLKNDYDLRLDISKKVMEALEKSNPDVAARLQYNSPNRDPELVKRQLPYVGKAYEIGRRELPPEQPVPVSMEQVEGNSDLPF